MQKETSLFIEILSDHLNKRVTSRPAEDVDWNSLYRLAQDHQVAGIVYYQCRDFIPKEYIAPFEKRYSAELFYYSNRLKETERIRKAFREAGIQFYTVKGMDAARFYPLPPLRTMGDSDFIVSDLPAAIQVMRKLGFEGEQEENVHEWSCERNGLPVELHDVLIKHDEKSTKKQLRFFRDLMPYVKDNTLDWNYHFLFMIAHLRKHFLFSGVGIRQFMDIAVLIKDGPELDWKWIEKKLGELEMRRFAHACYSLIEYWFGIIPPVPFKRSGDPEEMTEKIIGNGVFGEADPDNKKNWVRNFLIMEKRPGWVNRIVLLKKDFFPGYDFMVAYPGCGFLENRKYLLPFAWIVRFVRLIRSGEHKKAVHTIRAALLSRRELKKHSERIKKMGL